VGDAIELLSGTHISTSFRSHACPEMDAPKFRALLF
jgi:hypothetical protein